jgi:hypothetical protein
MLAASGAAIVAFYAYAERRGIRDSDTSIAGRIRL